MEGIQCSQYTFYNDFDSANFSRVELVPQCESSVTKQNSNKTVAIEVPDAEFNIWTKPDCGGTEFENGNRTWFYFGLKVPQPSALIRFNMIDLNKQGKMYSQGMAPVYRIVPGRPKWERVQDKPVYSIEDDIFTLTFKFRTPENTDNCIYFAFTYPYTYTELQKMLVNIDQNYLTITPISEDDIYYVRETITRSIEGRSIDLITITSYYGITLEREDRLKYLFPNQSQLRPHKFVNKKVIFVSARVHPGETPSSFVFNGLLRSLIDREDLTAQILRRRYVFKLIPFLNPDGVAKGHYRTDTRGVNLNRVYLNPNLYDHPSIYAARALIRYYHFGFEKEDYIPKCDNCQAGNQTDGSLTEEDENNQNENISKLSHMTLEEGDKPSWCSRLPLLSTGHNFCRNCGSKLTHTESKEEVKFENVNLSGHGDVNCNESGLFLYIDLHGHASKKGIFMYGNHFDDLDRRVECMLLPKLMSINNHHFHFQSCNFTERNMYLRDKRDGMSRAGSGRVAVLSLTGIIKSYTLECNYNTGRIVNVLPPTVRESTGKVHTLPVPPKYTPQLFEEVGKSLAASILDLTGENPFTRLPNSEFHTLGGLRDWLRQCCCSGDFGTCGRPKVTRCGRAAAAAAGSALPQGKTTRGVVIKSRPPHAKTTLKKPLKVRPSVVPIERKENQPSCSHTPPKSSARLGKVFKAKSHKDLSLKNKHNPAVGEKSMKTAAKAAKKVVMPQGKKPEAVECLEKKDESIRLREICFIKSNEGKTVIAKYKNKESEEFDDNLIVTWDAPTLKPTVFTHKTRVLSAPPLVQSKSLSEPSTSKGVFRVHNFAKNTFSKSKMKKVTLRRLASATDTLTKIEKKKKKKLKVK